MGNVYLEYPRASVRLRDEVKAAIEARAVQGGVTSPVTVSSDDGIPAGAEWSREIAGRIDRADILYVLVTAELAAGEPFESFLRHEIERRRAMGRPIVPIVADRVTNVLKLYGLGNVRAIPSGGLGIRREPYFGDKERWLSDVATEVVVAVQRVSSASLLASTPPEPLGLVFKPSGDRLVVDPSGDASDIAAAGENLTRSLYDEAKRKADDFVSRARRLDNQPGWEGIGALASRFDGLLALGLDSIPANIGTIYSLVTEFGSYVEFDDKIDPARSNYDRLEPDVRRALESLVGTSALLARCFPTARRLDEEGARFRSQSDLHDPAARALDEAHRLDLISREDRDLASGLIDAGRRGGFVGGKAGNRGVRSAINMTFKAAGFVATLMMGAALSNYSSKSPLMDKAGAYLVKMEREVGQLTAQHPFDIRMALEKLIADWKIEAAVLPGVPRIPDPGDAEDIFEVGDPAWPGMTIIPSGRFLMGAAESEEGSARTERPVHPVSIGYRLAIGRHPVTFEAWDFAVDAGASLNRPDDRGWGRGARPVINVSWEDAKAYIFWLNARLGLTGRHDAYRLPSEAEWEYACRAGTTTPFSFGETISTDQANYNGNYAYGRGKKSGVYLQRTSPVGSYPANGFGLHDMHGNVLEWCEDVWHEDYAGAPDDGSAWGTGDASRRVLRGGSWSNTPDNCRSAYRDWNNPTNRVSSTGFRLARTLSPPPP